MLENLYYNRIMAMLPVGLIGFMLQKKLEGGFYADPPKNKLGSQRRVVSRADMQLRAKCRDNLQYGRQYVVEGGFKISRNILDWLRLFGNLN